MKWEFYMNNYSQDGVSGVGFVADEDFSCTNRSLVRVFVGINNDFHGVYFIDKIGHLSAPSGSTCFGAHYYACDKLGGLTGEFSGHIGPYVGPLRSIEIKADEASRLISAARDLGTVHKALSEPLEKIIGSIEKAVKE